MADFILELIGGIFDIAGEMVIAMVNVTPKVTKLIVWLLIGIFILPFGLLRPHLRTRWLAWNSLQ